ncbi:MAG: hypothetical protein DMG15_02805 [Acidobacteria bacterium]|nr:MAG: hypothetical protein DMG15_02805 [Acidobacteriota bacterium]
MLTAVAISNYRSLRSIVVPLQNLNLVTGANGMRCVCLAIPRRVESCHHWREKEVYSPRFGRVPNLFRGQSAVESTRSKGRHESSP